MISLPKILLLSITHRCNCKCAMCSVWKYTDFQELSIEEISHLFGDRILSENLEDVSITGGEPLIRKDLTEIVEIILNGCKRLKLVFVTTNGIFTEKILSTYGDILKLIGDKKRIKFSTMISIDGIGKLHDDIRGVPGAFTKAMETLEGFRDLSKTYPNFSYSINTTISKYNCRILKDVVSYFAERGVGVTFALADERDYFQNRNFIDEFQVPGVQKADIAKFLRHMAFITGNPYYRDLLVMFQGHERSLYCPFLKDGCFIDATGDIFLCDVSRELRLGNIRERRFADIWFDPTGEEVQKKAARKFCYKCISNCGVWNFPSRKLLDRLRLIGGHHLFSIYRLLPRPIKKVANYLLIP